MVEQSLRELLDVLLRWVHLVAGIMWIGNSLLFNWLDRNLIRDAGGGDGTSPAAPGRGRNMGSRHVGRIWLLHSGGFYDVEKKFLAPNELPAVLHWFKWQAYTTWMSGVALLTLLYWTGGATLMIDPNVSALSPGQAAAIGVGVIVGGWVVYDGIWRLLGRVEAAAMALSVAALAGAVWGLTHLLSGRAAFIHVGAMMGTCMAGNVAMHIVPSQHRLVAATREGKPQDVAISQHAKQRSIHNNYITFPLLFTMVSNHFPGIYGSRLGWLLLAFFFAGGALVRHWLNIRFTFRAWVPAVVATILVSFGVVGVVVIRSSMPDAADPLSGAPSAAPVALASVEFVLHERCAPCHSDHPTIVSNPPAPAAVRFDTPEEIFLWRERIKARAVVTRTMPLNNRTGMTDEERETLASWLTQAQLPR
jgi:uncharacterized membrane protein